MKRSPLESSVQLRIPINSATDSDGIRPPLSRPRIIGDEIVP